MKRQKQIECSQCHRMVSEGNEKCPWCHTPIAQNTRRKWEDKNKYGVAALVFSVLFPPLGILLGALAYNRNVGAQQTMGKIALVIATVCIVLAIVAVLPIIEILYGIHY